MDVAGGRLCVGGVSNLRLSSCHGLIRGHDALYADAPRGWLWSTRDGTTWDTHTAPGFLDAPTCMGVHALGVFRDRLYIGTQHFNAPCEVWELTT
jgi:hypothetical protein